MVPDPIMSPLLDGLQGNRHHQLDSIALAMKSRSENARGRSRSPEKDKNKDHLLAAQKTVPISTEDTISVPIEGETTSSVDNSTKT